MVPDRVLRVVVGACVLLVAALAVAAAVLYLPAVILMILGFGVVAIVPIVWAQVGAVRTATNPGAGRWFTDWFNDTRP